MNHTGFMRRFQGSSDLFGDRQGRIQGNRPLRDPVGEGGAIHELQDERPRPLGLFDAVDLRDVGVVQRGEDLCLPLEPGEAIWIIGEGVR